MHDINDCVLIWRGDMLNNTSTDELIREATDGDAVALERLLLDHSSLLYRYISPQVPKSFRQLISVDDVLQETFAHVFRHIGEFRPRSRTSFVAWLKAIADSRLKDAVKRLRRKKRGGEFQRIDYAKHANVSSIADMVEMLSHHGATPSQLVAKEEATTALNIALAGLKEDYREAIRMRYLEGNTVEVVAQRMGRSLGAIRGLLDRGKAKLRAALGRSSLYLTRR